MTRKARRAANRNQDFANRENSKLSTGPITEHGKETSKMNALKHGLTAMKPYLPSEQQSYEAFADARTRNFNPQTEAEQSLVQLIIDTEWRIQRIAGLEARLFADLESDAHKTIRSLDTLSRHELRLRKLLTNTIAELSDIVQTRQKLAAAKALAARKNPNGFVLQHAEQPSASQTDFSDLDDETGTANSNAEAA